VAASTSARPSSNARSLIADENSELLFSAASIWEVATKAALGKPGITADPRLYRRGLADNGYVHLPITGEHAVALDRVPNRPSRRAASRAFHPIVHRSAPAGDVARPPLPIQAA
jgi:PIN domain nuclease of toxin-antitoxin system